MGTSESGEREGDRERGSGVSEGVKVHKGARWARGGATAAGTSSGCGQDDCSRAQSRIYCNKKRKRPRRRAGARESSVS